MEEWQPGPGLPMWEIWSFILCIFRVNVDDISKIKQALMRNRNRCFNHVFPFLKEVSGTKTKLDVVVDAVRSWLFACRIYVANA